MPASSVTSLSPAGPKGAGPAARPGMSNGGARAGPLPSRLPGCPDCPGYPDCPDCRDCPGYFGHRPLPAHADRDGNRPALRLTRRCRQFRRWGLDHRAEFGLLFGTPLPSLEGMHHHALINECAARFSGTFFALFLELWRRQPFSVPPPGTSMPACGRSWSAIATGSGRICRSAQW